LRIAAAPAVTRKPVLRCVAVLGTLGALGVAAAAAVVYGGLYNVAATAQHTKFVHSLLETAMHHSVRRRARDVVVPAAYDAPPQLQRGAACYRARCEQCHGGPGVANEAIGMAMQPVPGSLIAAARTWRARELYWITRHGIKMSGMPSWQHHLSEDELWSVVAFVQQLPALTPARYAETVERAGSCHDARAPSIEAPAPSATAAERAARGRLALRMYGCHSCHSIPGVTSSEPQIGPPLDGIASRQLIAGQLANSHDNLVAWIREPRRIDPRSAMPDHAVTPQHADEMAAYLQTLR
jgi:mono/diheme cytochrome c family protein